MANTRSAKKRMRQNVKRRLRNRLYRSRARTMVKRASEAVAQGDPDAAAEAVALAARELDRSAGKGVIHKNNAARRKSRLMKRLAALREKP